MVQGTTPGRFSLEPVADSGFGATVRFAAGRGLFDIVVALEAAPGELRDAFYAAGGLLVLTGMQELTVHPELLVRISRLFGPDVENYHETLTPEHMIHQQVPEILVLSNRPPCDRQPPSQPDPPRTADGGFPVRFPHRRGWHTDQSFRRPPPDLSLFLAVITSPKGQGQTLFADGAAAYQALPALTKARIADLDGLHALLGTGRSEQAVRAGEAVKPLLPHQRSQRQPLVRIHPVTGKPALYLCEAGQMDWHDGPIVGLQPGCNGDGAALIYQLMNHYTAPDFTYVHDWDEGDLVVYDNRNLIHAATWYDAQNYTRLMWRTTVMGNPGVAYQGEAKSWIPAAGVKPMDGLGEGKWDPSVGTSR